MNDERKAILRSMPDLVTRDEVLQLVAAKPDAWRIARVVCRITCVALLYAIAWCATAFFTDPYTASFITLLLLCWTAPRLFRRV